MNENKPTDNEVESALDSFGVYSSTTRGPSMRPLFRTHKDIVIITKPNKPIRRYDVVLYRGDRTGKYILHRVIKVKDGHYVIRGDNTFENELVGVNEIIGVLSEFIRGGKHRTVNSVGYRFYSVAWTFIYPLRFVAHKITSFLKAIYRMIFRRKEDGGR